MDFVGPITHRGVRQIYYRVLAQYDNLSAQPGVLKDRRYAKNYVRRRFKAIMNALSLEYETCMEQRAILTFYFFFVFFPTKNKVPETL